MAEQPLRPEYFITRQNGTMVPLIALDELPLTVIIRGVPRTLSTYDVAGMKGLGTAESRHRAYVVDGLKSPFPPVHKDQEKGLSASKHASPSSAGEDWQSFLARLAKYSPSTPLGSDEPQQPKGDHVKNSQPSFDRSQDHAAHSVDAAKLNSTIDDLARLPATGVKEYCSYWIRRGECDYAQQGCLYRHDMPLDRESLEKLGLRDIPRWYRERHGLGSYLAVSAQKTTPGNMRQGLRERSWRGRPDTPVVNGKSTATTAPKPCGPRVWTSAPALAPIADIASNNKKADITSSSNLPKEEANSTAPVRAGDLSGKGPLAKTAPMSYRAANSAPTGTYRPGTQHVPADTEKLSSRMLHETIRQLDACEEQERALKMYAPLVPLKFASAPSALGGAGRTDQSAPDVDHDDGFNQYNENADLEASATEAGESVVSWMSEGPVAQQQQQPQTRRMELPARNEAYHRPSRSELPDSPATIVATSFARNPTTRAMTAAPTVPAPRTPKPNKKRNSRHPRTKTNAPVATASSSSSTNTVTTTSTASPSTFSAAAATDRVAAVGDDVGATIGRVAFSGAGPASGSGPGAGNFLDRRAQRAAVARARGGVHDFAGGRTGRK